MGVNAAADDVRGFGLGQNGAQQFLQPLRRTEFLVGFVGQHHEFAAANAVRQRHRHVWARRDTVQVCVGDGERIVLNVDHDPAG